MQSTYISTKLVDGSLEKEGFQMSYRWPLHFFPTWYVRNILPESKPAFAVLVPPSCEMAAYQRSSQVDAEKYQE